MPCLRTWSRKLVREGSEEVDSLHVDDVAGDDDGPGFRKVRVVVVIQQQAVGERVIHAQVAAFGNVLYIASGEALKSGHVPVVRRDDDNPVGGVVDRKTTSHFSSLRVVNIADVGAGIGADEKLSVNAHIDAVVIAVGDHGAAGNGHRTHVDQVEASANFRRVGLARIVGRRIANRCGWSAGYVQG